LSGKENDANGIKIRIQGKKKKNPEKNLQLTYEQNIREDARGRLTGQRSLF